MYEGAQILVTMGEHLLDVAKVLLNAKSTKQVESANLPISEVETANEDTQSPVLVSEMGLSTRLTNALVNNGFEDLRSLAGLTEEEVSNMKGMGEVSYKELKDILDQHDIQLI
jgi:DNA-directed RNA polymerase alpha subunit